MKQTEPYSARKHCSAVFLGRIDYASALELQMEIARARKQGLGADTLLFLEHPPTITLGRNGDWQNLRVPREILGARGVSVFEVDRGGDITFHGPGQLVGYPVLELGPGERDVRRYMRTLEEVVIRALCGYGIEARREQGRTGVWTEQGKIAALGVHISRWVTRHGFALNVETELEAFEMIVPCGISGARVTSMRALTGRRFDLPEVAASVGAEFETLFGRRLVWTGIDALGRDLGLERHPTGAARGVA